MGQGDRDDVITGFKKKAFPILVATDVAGKRICVLLIICMLAALFVIIVHKWNMFWYSVLNSNYGFISPLICPYVIMY